MKLGTVVRRSHRWISILSFVTVAGYIVTAPRFGTPPPAVTYAPLAPLFLLMFTGAYMLVRPGTGAPRATE